jgi:N-acyl amino acid synthase of PEP-CTERM/exosortase system
VLDTEFRYYLADTDAGKSLHYRLRYDVYCLREQFEDQKKFADKQEIDKYDRRSIHFLVQSRTTGDWVGAMRLVLGKAQNLPMGQIAPIDWEIIAGLDGEMVAEASRLCALSPKPRQRHEDFGASRSSIAIARPDNLPNRRFHASLLAIGLIRAARHYCIEKNIETCFFLINDPLARILKQLGMGIDPVGSPFNHRGWRRPYIHNVKKGYREMAYRSPELYKSFCRPTAYHYYSELDQLNEPMTMAISA